jgi:hypothetical protein
MRNQEMNLFNLSTYCRVENMCWLWRWLCDGYVGNTTFPKRCCDWLLFNACHEKCGKKYDKLGAISGMFLPGVLP